VGDVTTTLDSQDRRQAVQDGRACVGTVRRSGWETRTRRRCRGGADCRDGCSTGRTTTTRRTRRRRRRRGESGEGEGERRLCPEREHSSDGADQGTPDKITVDPADAMDRQSVFFSEPRPSWALTLAITHSPLHRNLHTPASLPRPVPCTVYSHEIRHWCLVTRPKSRGCQEKHTGRRKLRYDDR
jgi:hypothetical protein